MKNHLLTLVFTLSLIPNAIQAKANIRAQENRVKSITYSIERRILKKKPVSTKQIKKLYKSLKRLNSLAKKKVKTSDETYVEELNLIVNNLEGALKLPSRNILKVQDSGLIPPPPKQEVDHSLPENATGPLHINIETELTPPPPKEEVDHNQSENATGSPHIEQNIIINIISTILEILPF